MQYALDIRRIASVDVKEELKLTQAELDKQKAEFFAKGGQIKEVPFGVSAIDFAANHKPGETYGKHAY